MATTPASSSRTVPLLDLTAQYATLRSDIRAAIDRVCDAQRFIGGPEVAALEAEVAAYCGCKHGIGVTSGTDALLCGMMALGIGPGDEVIVPTFTFFATAGCVARLGATPVFVDVCPRTFNVRAEDIAPRLSPRTRLIIPVHLFGQCADMDPIAELAASRDIPILEDAAQSIGSTYRGRKAGQFGRLTALSFFPSKNLGAFGDAGMILTDDDALEQRCRILREHGSKPKYYHAHIGGNFRLDAIQAAVLRVKLRHLDGWTAARIRNGRRYDEMLASTPVVTPYVAEHNRTIYNQYVIRAPRRDALRERLQQRGIGAEIYYPVPLHLQQCFAYLGGSAGQLPHAEAAAREVLALPVYPELPPDAQEYVVRAIRDFYAGESGARG